MRLYTVHYRRRSRDSDRDLVLVKDGFSWPGFLFTPLWALGSGLWLAAVLIVVAQALVGSLPLGEAGPGLLTVLLALAVGVFGNEIKRWTLARRGFALAGIAGGTNAEEAFRNFLLARPDIRMEMSA